MSPATPLRVHVRRLVRLLEQWWNDPADYRWLTALMDSRGLLPAMKAFIAFGGLVLALISALVQFSSSAPDTIVGRVVCGLVSVLALVWAMRWAFGEWPTPGESLRLCVAADVAITVACVFDSNRLAGLAGTTLFVVTGAYITFFHGPRLHAAHVVWATVSVVAFAVWMGVDGGTPALVLAVAKALIALIVIVGILPVLQFGYWLIRTSAVDSLVDPLTGLANRRGLDHHIAHTFTAGPATTVCAILVDLDNFKAINDRYGHAVGDRVLVRVADRIQRAVDAGGFTARLGGEEFLVLHTLSASVAAELAERVRLAVAEPADPPITASVGVALTDHPRGLATGTGDIGDLLAAADTAMYAAKQLGGDAVRHHAA
ncbi:GGDEF domain-containing protein [Williamsia sterculiae]|uniref:Diguanylate cyclase (GGDEF) domain-containing protein n=1 Tax=Williamsia sterculiae TaxID=1344003 RepID=A0A1N7EH48_9NOCA|nr:diguanylate cyclase [Williamsia sterculiae]SIR87406.1 diguanylate cyclase (GGDEF) domain-containing protein [Williamsia sterculiae]